MNIPANPLVIRFRPLSQTAAAAVLFLWFAATLPAQAQQALTIAPSSGVAPVEVYSGTNYSGVHSNGVTVSTVGGTDQVDLQVTNLPAGVTVFPINSFVPPSASTFTVNTFFGIAVTNVTAGDYTLYLVASSTNTSIVPKTRTFGLHVGGMEFWRPAVTNNNSWATDTNWSPTILPPGANVKFEDQQVELGGTNTVTANTTIGRLSYLRAVNNTQWRTILSSGVTLTVTNGFSANNVSADNGGGTGHNFGVAVSGSGGANLIVTNRNKDFALNCVNSAAPSTTFKFDFSGLPNLKTYVNRFGVADLSLITEGTVGSQEFRCELAQNTVVVAYYVDPGAYTGEHFTNSIQFFNHNDNTAYQNGQVFTNSLGSSTTFWADSFGLARGRVGSSFNVLRPRSGGATAQFRNSDGVSRMTLLGVGVDSGVNTINSGCRGNLDFSGSSLDVLADTLWLGRCRPRNGVGGANIAGTISYSGGTVDVNTAVLGYQINTNDNFCQGAVNATNATFIVNSLLVLGYSIGDYLTNGPYAAGGFGRLNLSGGTCTGRVNTVTVGGPSNLSTNNSITIASGAKLFLTNTIGTAVAKLNNLTASTGTIALHINGLDPKIYAKSLTTLGSGNTISIPAITNIGAYPVTIPLIVYETSALSGGTNFALGTMPAASPSYGGYLTNDTSANTISLVLTNGGYQPGPVTWTGLSSGDWDTTTTNWVNVSTPYKYADGVPVRFDDSGLTASINLTAARAPSRTVVSNNTVAYTFTGAKLGGTGGLTKQGTATLFIANTGVNDFTGSINLTGGTLQIGIGGTAGNLGGGNITNNAALVFNRSDNLTVSNTVSGTGSLTQNGLGLVTLTAANTFTGPTAINAGGLALLGSSAIPGSTSIFVAAGAVLDVSGRNDGTLTLASGQTLQGNGIIRGSLLAGPGATISPGASVGRLTATNAIALQGNTSMEIDKANGTNDVLSTFSTITYGGTLSISVLNNPLAAGDSFKLFNAASYSGSFSSIAPASPGIGLLWDTSSLNSNGVLKVVSDTLPGTLTWSGALDTNWDTTTTNWLNSGIPSAYADGVPVKFDDSALTSLVNLTTTLAPSDLRINNSTQTYTFSGSGKLTGNAALLKQGTNTLIVANSGVNDFSGNITLSGGTVQVGNGGTNGNLGAGNITNNASLTFNRTDTLNVSNRISGIGALTLNGSGTVSLAGTNSYAGPTTISSGKLALLGGGGISGSANIIIASGAVLDASSRTDGTLTLASGQTLQGNGTVLGNLTAGFGSTVSPGASVGYLSISNAVLLQGNMRMEIDKTAGTNDLLRAGSITYGGTLSVSNLSAAFEDGDAFKIFDADTYSGAFTNIIPKKPGSGLAWDTSALTDSGTLSVILAPPVTPSASVKIDFSIAGRAEAIDPNFSSWVIPGGTSTSSNFSGLTITLTRVGPFGTGLTGDWWKSGVDDLHCLMADDGVTVENGNQGGQIELRISGLSPGPHTIATYHNTWQDPTSHTFSPLNISINGVLTITNLVPSNRVTNNYDAASAFMQVVAEEDQDVVILYQAETNNAATDKNVWISGLEIDTVASTLKALNPSPANGDEHVDADSGSLTLTWQAAQSAVSHDVYFGTSSNNVSTATHVSPEFKGNQPGTNYVVTNLNSLLTYYWRVDEVDATNGVSKGDLWEFRKRHLAFPGAEGYGRFARGGRGGRVIEVTNVNDSGPGSFRDAVSQTLADSGPRTIVFAVSGLITLESALTVSKDQSKIYIAGQTAPGKGINIRKYSFGFSGGEDVIVRHLRSYPGKLAGITLNGMGFGGVDHSIMDHCSSGWSLDECIPSRGAKNMTIQNVMIAEPLNQAGHKNYPPGTRHGYASSTSGDIGSWHHDLLAQSEGRNWSLAGGLTGDGNFAGRLDIRCNVVYNWDGRTTDGGVAELNFVNNYYKVGPVNGIKTYLNPDHGTNSDGSYGQRYYSSGNVMPGYPQSNSGGWMTNAPFFPSYVTTQSASNAYKIVLSEAGCYQPVQDDHDARIIQETRDGTYHYSGSASGLPGLPDSENDVGGWENYPEIHRDANWDTDHDGLPDWWEVMHGLNTNSAPGDFSDSNADLVGDEYTELDRYLSFMAGRHADCPYNGSVDIDLSKFAYGFSLTSPSYSLFNPTNGTVAMLGDGKTARFTATNTFNGLGGLGAFVFRVMDSQGDTMTNLVGIHVLAPQNTAPVLAAVSNRTINVGVNLVITNSATDSDGPAQTLTFTLASGPTNSTLGTNSGIFSWRPFVTQANSTNPVTVVVADNGSPTMSATQSFNITVNPLTLPGIVSPLWDGGQFSLSVTGQLGPDYAIQTSTNLVDWATELITNSPVMPFDWLDTAPGPYSSRFYRIKVGPPLP